MKDSIFDEQKCRICGCTWDHACPGGCYWVEEDLCSACAEKLEDENFIQNKFGYCFYCLEPSPTIYNLYVHPQYRQTGQSKVLLRHVINAIKKSGYTGEIEIKAEPRENSICFDKLVEYYKTMGLKVIE